MNKIKTLAKQQTWIGYNTQDLAWTIGITVAIVISPAVLAHSSANQILTGTVVNALLFLAAYRMPLMNAFIIAALPSSIALMRGLLPAPMVMLIPYIIFSNIILISVFSFFKKLPLQGVVVASLAKFALLYSVIFFLAQKLNNPLIAMFQWPQLITALLGGFTFLTLLKVFKIKKA
jgi:hypothetical protein